MAGIGALETRLRARLAAASAPLPGAAAHARMAPRPRRLPGDHGSLLDSAVLILLYPTAAGVGLVLTRRTDTVASHRSQVSLPGGRREDGETLEQTALRECAEELAVDPAQVTVLGLLSPLEVHASGFRIQPVVGCAELRPEFRPHAGEVAEVLETTLEELDGCIRDETWTHEGFTRQVPLFLVKGHKVWGATAMILSEMLAVVREAV